MSTLTLDQQQHILKLFEEALEKWKQEHTYLSKDITIKSEVFQDGAQYNLNYSSSGQNISKTTYNYNITIKFSDNLYKFSYSEKHVEYMYHEDSYTNNKEKQFEDLKQFLDALSHEYFSTLGPVIKYVEELDGTYVDKVSVLYDFIHKVQNSDVLGFCESDYEVKRFLDQYNHEVDSVTIELKRPIFKSLMGLDITENGIKFEARFTDDENNRHVVETNIESAEQLKSIIENIAHELRSYDSHFFTLYALALEDLI